MTAMNHSLVGLFLLLCSVAAPAAVVGPSGGAIEGAQPATVWEVNPSGVGHVNLVPYFTVKSGFDTYLNIVNTDTRNGKAVKVRLRSAVFGEDAGNFTVLLGPGDRWAAALTRDAATGGTRVAHSDRSCTLPAELRGVLLPGYLPFLTEPAGPGPHMQEGSIEIVTLADIPRFGDDGRASPLFDAVTARSAVSAATCSPSALAPLTTDSTSYADARVKGLAVPTSGLMTQWTLINVPRATSYAGRATAVEARVALAGAPGYGNVVLFPQTTNVINNHARLIATTTDPRLRGGSGDNRDAFYQGTVRIETYREDAFPDLSTPYLPSGLSNELRAGVAPRLQAFAISKALATDSIAGEFATEPSVLAKTDWVVTLPTRYLQVAFFPGGMLGTFPEIWMSSYQIDDTGTPVGSGIRNFFETGTNVGDPTSAAPCVTAIDPYTAGTPPISMPFNETSFRDPEGASIALAPETVSGTARAFTLCGQSVVLRFSDTSADGVVGDGQVRRTMLPPTLAGWGRIALAGVSGQGLPMIGFAATELFNSAVAPGFAGAFGISVPLVTTRPVP